MKRIISLLLVSVLLFSLGVIGYAEEQTLTADLVLERLAATECETQEDQVVNGAIRLAEMTVTLDSMSIETQEEADQLNNILDNLAAINVPEESFEHKRGVALTRVLDGLVIFQEQFDRDGRYTDQLNMILESFDTCDDKAETDALLAALDELGLPDDDPLLFYRAIAQYAQTALKPDGWLYFEINPLENKQVSE